MPTDMTAKDFAEGIQNMRFGDVMTVVNAINSANTGTRNRIDGEALIDAAKLIIDGGGAVSVPPAKPTASNGSKAAAKTA